MKFLVTALLLLCSTSIMAQVVSVNVYQPLPGKNALLTENFREAKAIQEALGATVAISSDMKGIYRYAIIMENWQAYGEFVERLVANQAWQAFQRKISANPSATQIDNLQLNQRAATGGEALGPGAVTDVTIWELTTGTMNQLIEGGMGAKPIHERAGARVTVLAAGGNTMYYLTQFESPSDWGRFRDTPNPEFNQYMQGLNEQNNGDLGAVVIERNTLNAL
jgi:hypothetical protein